MEGFDVIGTRMDFGAAEHQFSHLLDVMSGDQFREGKGFGHQVRHHYLVDGAVGVGRDDSTTGEVDALAGQILSESPLLAFDTLVQ